MAGSKIVTTSEELSKLIQEAIGGLGQQDYGYIGNNGIVPLFAQEIADAKTKVDDLKSSLNDYNEKIKDINYRMSQNVQKIDEINKLLLKGEYYQNKHLELEESIKKIIDEISKTEDKLNSASGKKKDKIQEQLDIQNKKLNNLNEELDKIDNVNALESERIKLQMKNEAEQEKIRGLEQESLDDQLALLKVQTELNEKREEGVTLEERINHQLDNRIMNTRRFNNGWSETKQGFSQMVQTLVDVSKRWREINQSVHDYGRHIGVSGTRLQQMQTQIQKDVNGLNLQEYYNTNVQDVIEMREKMSSAASRNISMGQSNYEKMAAMKSILGTSEAAASFAGGLESFGFDSNRSADMLGKIFNNSERKGISFEKYSKNFLDNIKMAQQYTFKNGIDGLKNMTEQSTKLRFNMQETAKFAEKVSTVEGAVQASANLSVLGGSFAAYSNPMSMMYEGLNDAEGLQDRLIKMYGNKAYFDKKTGQISVSAMDRQFIKAAVQATGGNYSDVMDSIFAQGRRGQIEGQIKGNITGDLRENILNTAQLDEKGRGYLTVNGQKKYVDEMSAKELEQYGQTAVPVERNVETIAQSMLSMDEKINGIKEAMKDTVAEKLDGIMNTVNNGLTNLLPQITSIIPILAGIYIAIKGLSVAMGLGKMGSGAYNMATSFGGRTNAINKMQSQPAMPGNVNTVKTGVVNNGTYSGVNSNYIAGRQLGMTKNEAAVNAYRDARRAGMSPTQARRAMNLSIARGNISKGLGKFKMGAGASMGAGLGLSFGGMALSSLGNSMEQSERAKNGENADLSASNTVSTLGSMASYAGTGAMFGSMFGPWGTAIGAGIGALIGLGTGLYDAHSKNEALEKGKLIKSFNENKSPIQLNPDNYTIDELRKLNEPDMNSFKLRNNSDLKELHDKVVADNGGNEPNFQFGGLINLGGNEYQGGNDGGRFSIYSRDTGSMYPFRFNPSKESITISPNRNNMNIQQFGPSDNSVSTPNFGFGNNGSGTLNVTGSIELKLPNGNSTNISDRELMSFVESNKREIAKIIFSQTHQQTSRGYSKESNMRNTGWH